MKNHFFLFVTVFIFFNVIRAQQLERQMNREEVFIPETNNAHHPCISPQEYTLLNQECARNRSQLGLEKDAHRNNLATPLSWPLRRATGFNDCDYYFIGAYVDQNTAATSVTDYNCETNTYDSHHGTDIAIWPYGFYKMDNNMVEVVAAAAGTIIQKADGNFDRNCASNALTANSIIIQHADGSCALYWHMKKNSLTAKSVGQTVAAGEYLGVVGSSGSSSGPHTHFEIWAGTTNTTYKDPFAGSCNTLNPDSWWISQKPHTNPAILKVSTNATDLVMPGCPTTETPNESDSFTIPFQGPGLPAGYAKFYMFFRELTVGDHVDLKIVNPNGSTFSSWTYNVTTFYKVSYWGWSKVLPTISGNYTFQATYNGVSCSKPFQIVNPLDVTENIAATEWKIYPNPTDGNLNLSGSVFDNGEFDYNIANVSGQIIKSEHFSIADHQLHKSISIEEFPKGIYFFTLLGGNTKITRKIIRQ